MDQREPLPELIDSWGYLEDRGGFGQIACVLLLIPAVAAIVFLVAEMVWR